MKFQKYIDALNLMDLVIAAKGDRDQEHKTWDDLYQYIYEHFSVPDTSNKNWNDIILKVHTEVLDMKKCSINLMMKSLQQSVLFLRLFLK